MRGPHPQTETQITFHYLDTNVSRYNGRKCKLRVPYTHSRILGETHRATRFIRIHNLCSSVFLNNATVKCKILNRRVHETQSYENLNFAATSFRERMQTSFPGLIGACTLPWNVTFTVKIALRFFARGNLSFSLRAMTNSGKRYN